jgi:large subunit ribosomal protein L30
MTEAKKLKVTLVKSPIGCNQNHRQTVRGLGLRRIRHTVEVVDSPQVRGMLRQVAYLVRVESPS